MNRGLAMLSMLVVIGAVLSLRVALTTYGSAGQVAGSTSLVLFAVAAGLFAGAIIAGRSKGKFLPLLVTRAWLNSVRRWAENKERETRRPD